MALPAGSKSFWGIPFELSPAEGNSWIVLDQVTQSHVLPLSGFASHLLFCHFSNQSNDPEGKAQPAEYRVGDVTRPGEHLANYTLVYADGDEFTQPIRRRFEIGEAKMSWGQLAFAARPHIEDEAINWRGPYAETRWGWHQTGVGPIRPEVSLQYWIFALDNPNRNKRLAALRFESTGADRVAIAGLTLYHGQKNPLQRRRLETLRVSLPDRLYPRDVETVKDLGIFATSFDGSDIKVDLGTISKIYTVPPFKPKKWLKHVPKGWGEEGQAPGPTNEILLDITANSEATLSFANHQVDLSSVFQDGKDTSKDNMVKVEILSPERTWVHVTVIDDQTGQPTSVRVHFSSREGRYLAPHGHRTEVNDNWFEDYGGDLKLGSKQYAYVDGEFQIELPTEDVYVEIVKGCEFEPVRQRIDIEPGQRQLQLHISRPLNWRKKGWVTADTHVHFISPQTAWLEAQAEGVNIVNLLASQWGDLFTNVTDFTGDVSGVSRDDTLVWVGTENRQHILGHISLLGIRGKPVFPLCAGGPEESYLGDPLWSSIADWADLCREREGLVVVPHFPTPYCEVAADIVLGKVDAAEIRYFTPSLDSFNIREWYRFLNCGYKIAAVGGTDKMWAGMPVGGVRTYAHIGDKELSFDNWAEAVRAGRTFTTSGPLIGLEVEGYTLGDELQLPLGGGTLEVKSWVHSVQPVHEWQLVVNGELVAREEIDNNGTLEANFSTRIHLKKSAWIAARCVSRHIAWHGWPVNMAAHTSPIYVQCGDNEIFNPSDATFMQTLIEGGLTWLDTLSIPADPARQAKIRAVFESAGEKLHDRLHNHFSHK